MKKNFDLAIRRSVVIVGIVSSANAMGAKVFHHKMWGIAPVDGLSCDEYAWQAGERLADYVSSVPQGSGFVKVVDSSCFNDLGGGNGTWNVDIAYESESPLEKVSTTSNSSSVMYLPGYKTAEECEAALVNEQPFFENKTGLNVFAAWCRRASYPRWELNIEAFGQAVLRPYLSGTTIFGKIVNHDIDSFSAVIRERFAARNAEITQLELAPAFAYQELRIRYYGSDQLRMVENVVVKTATGEQCLDQLQRLDANLQTNGVKTYGTFCTTGTPGTAFELMSLTEKTESIRLSHPEETFEDFSACYAQRDAIAELYRTRYRRNVIDAVCGYNRDAKAYKVVVVDKPVAAEI